MGFVADKGQSYFFSRQERNQTGFIFGKLQFPESNVKHIKVEKIRASCRRGLEKERKWVSPRELSEWADL
jgi:hypothetical protein